MSSEENPTAHDSCVNKPKEMPLKSTPRRRLPPCKSVNSKFKSPLQCPTASPCQSGDQLSLQEEVEDLKKKAAELSADIASLESEGVGVEELEEHIQLLHEYNDIKDVGQMLLGKLAVIRGVTTRELYGHFGLELDD